MIKINIKKVKNANWLEVSQLTKNKRGRARDYREQIQLAVRMGIKLGASANKK